MAGFHIPEDPYYPNKGNGGWIKEDQEEVSEEDLEEDPDEEEEEAMMRKLTQNLRSTILLRRHQTPDGTFRVWRPSGL